MKRAGLLLRTMFIVFGIVCPAAVSHAELIQKADIDAKEYVVYDDQTGKYWYCYISDFAGKEYTAQKAQIKELNHQKYYGSNRWQMAKLDDVQTLWKYSAEALISRFGHTFDKQFYDAPENHGFKGRYNERGKDAKSHYIVGAGYDELGDGLWKISLNSNQITDSATPYNVGAWVVTDGPAPGKSAGKNNNETLKSQEAPTSIIGIQADSRRSAMSKKMRPGEIPHKLGHLAFGMLFIVLFWQVMERRHRGGTVNPFWVLPACLWGACGLFFFKWFIIDINIPILREWPFFMAFPDMDIKAFGQSAHRSMIFHSVLVPFLLLAVALWRKRLWLRDVGIGFTVGVSSHLAWDIVQFVQRAIRKDLDLLSITYFRHPMELIGYSGLLFLLANIVIGLVCAYFVTECNKVKLNEGS